MKQKFIDYELHLQMFIDYGADEHAKHLVGEPIKPEGYDEYKALQNNQNQIIENKKDTFSYTKFTEKLEEHFTEKDSTEGINYDEEGIPQYLTTDDHYKGIENPVWVKKYTKKDPKPTTHKDIPNEKLGINYDEDGIPEYLTTEAYHFGEVNPEWLKKHKKK
ncbi:hypothetical protein AD998_06675 [bacterium 336/3]|nr:hypothetical protein AD998_06675 [bacterium 336/3]